MTGSVYQKFIGCWKLVSVTVKNKDNLIYPFGHDLRGVLYYSESGYVSVQIMMPVGYPVTDERKKSFNLEQLAQTLKSVGYMGYFGTVTVDEEKKVIVHKIEGSIAQPLVNGDEVRNYRFDKNHLYLSSGDMELKWKKM